MKKRLVALLLAFSLSVCMCVSAFAADTGIDIIDDPLSYYFQNQLLGVQKGTGVTLVCPNGDYKVLYTGGTLVTCPYDGEALVLADAGGVTAKKAPSGIGRKDLPGYADDNGTPNISSDGILYTLAVPYGIVNVDNTAFYTELSTSYNYVLGSSGSGTSGSSSVSFVYTFTVPETGLYYLYNTAGLSLGSYQIFHDGESWNEYLKSPKKFSRYSSNKTFEKGTKVYLFIYIKGDRWYGGCPFKYSINSIPICYEPLGGTTINNYNKITINNNNWNGNIYVDNTKNLTYIYPQYTTINENNETVTNISTNPIIYNNETKQYYTYDTVTNNYYYITYETTPTPTPSPSATPAPTWTPGGGATRGGGVGRTPSDTDAADWTLHYYILNNRRYDAYYALKKTEVDTETKLPWVDNKKYISTTQIPIANGQYTVSVPDGVYWRVWQWDEASQTLTGLNSSNWHSTINNFLFNATGEYIFEFCKADGSDFDTAKDVTLKLKNDKITDYEDGGTIVEEPTPSPSPDPTETPSPTPTATPTPGGGTVPTPGGDSGGGNSGSSDSGWNPFKWLTDLLKDIVEGIIKAIWKLITALFGFLLWLLSLVGSLFPFIPSQAVLAVTSAVVIVAVIRIIKFITGR